MNNFIISDIIFLIKFSKKNTSFIRYFILQF